MITVEYVCALKMGPRGHPLFSHKSLAFYLRPCLFLQLQETV